MRIYIHVLAVTLLSAVTHAGLTNRVLMVDQDGRFNLPEVLATQAQLATNTAAIAIAEAKAQAAAEAAAEGTNMISAVVDQIASSQLVIYRQGYIDSLTSDIALPPDTRATILGLQPNTGTTAGKVRHTVKYAVSRSADGIEPDVLYSDTIAGGRDAMQPLPAEQIGAPRKLGETYTSPDGTVFPYVYEVDLQVDPSVSGFFVIYLSGDASADGAVFEVTGGISGGASTEVPFGSKTLIFKGGLLVEVKE